MLYLDEYCQKYGLIILNLHIFKDCCKFWNWFYRNKIFLYKIVRGTWLSKSHLVQLRNCWTDLFIKHISIFSPPNSRLWELIFTFHHPIPHYYQFLSLHPWFFPLLWICRPPLSPNRLLLKHPKCPFIKKNIFLNRFLLSEFLSYSNLTCRHISSIVIAYPYKLND